MWVISAGWRIVIADRKISIEYRVKRVKEKREKVAFFFLFNYPTKVYTNYLVEIFL